MIPTRRSLFPTLALLLTVGLWGCASGGLEDPMGGGEGDGTVSVQIDNDLVPPASVTVYIVPETGSRRRLGPINPGGQGTFSFNPGIRTSDFRLLANVNGQRDVASNPFSLTGASAIRWSLSDRIVRVSR